MSNNLLARFVAQSPPLILTAVAEVANQAVATVEAGRRRRCRQSRVEQGPAAADPVTVAGIHQLVRPPRQSAFRCILPRRDPRDQQRQVEGSVAIRLSGDTSGSSQRRGKGVVIRTGGEWLGARPRCRSRRGHKRHRLRGLRCQARPPCRLRRFDLQPRVSARQKGIGIMHRTSATYSEIATTPTHPSIGPCRPAWPEHRAVVRRADATATPSPSHSTHR